MSTPAEHPSNPDQLMARALGVCWHSPGGSALWPCTPLADWEIELLRGEVVTAPAEDPRSGEACECPTCGCVTDRCQCDCCCRDAWRTSPVWRKPAAPPAAGRGDTDSSGECQQSDWCGPGSHCLCRPAVDRAEPPEGLRKLRADMIAALPGVHPWGEVVDRLLAGPLAALLDAQAAVGRVEALAATWEARSRSYGAADDRDKATELRLRATALRRALGGSS